MNWQDLLKLPFFNEDLDHVAELLDVEPESVEKLFNLYVERSHILYKGNDVILWLKEIIGFLISAQNQRKFD